MDFQQELIVVKWNILVPPGKTFVGITWEIFVIKVQNWLGET